MLINKHIIPQFNYKNAMPKIILFTILSLFLSFSSSHAERLKVFVLLSEPLGYLNKQGEKSGTHWDYMTAIAKRSGIKMDMTLAPKARVFGGVKNGTIDAAIFFRTKKRDNQVEYVEKIRSIRVVAINRKGLPLNRYEDLRKSTLIGKMRSTFLGDKFDQDPLLKIYNVNNYDSMINMFKKGRLDTVTGNAIALTHLLNKYKLQQIIERPGIPLGNKEQWLQMSKKSNKLHLIPHLRKAIQELKSEGVLDQILTNNVGKGWKVINSLQ